VLVQQRWHKGLLALPSVSCGHSTAHTKSRKPRSYHEGRHEKGDRQENQISPVIYGVRRGLLIALDRKYWRLKRGLDRLGKVETRRRKLGKRLLSY
jgi:hypothetical protein